MDSELRPEWQGKGLVKIRGEFQAEGTAETSRQEELVDVRTRKQCQELARRHHQGSPWQDLPPWKACFMQCSWPEHEVGRRALVHILNTRAIPIAFL